jgi:hypothetical protein
MEKSDSDILAVVDKWPLKLRLVWAEHVLRVGQIRGCGAIVEVEVEVARRMIGRANTVA